jgi:hypothetical protein
VPRQRVNAKAGARVNDLSTLKASFTVAFSIKVKSATCASYSSVR